MPARLPRPCAPGRARHTLSPPPACRDPTLGLVGPVIRAEVGDTIEVVFKNSLPFPGEPPPAGCAWVPTPMRRRRPGCQCSWRRCFTAPGGRTPGLHIGSSRSRLPACPTPAATIHPHGVAYLKASEGSPYFDGTMGETPPSACPANRVRPLTPFRAVATHCKATQACSPSDTPAQPDSGLKLPAEPAFLRVQRRRRHR